MQSSQVGPRRRFDDFIRQLQSGALISMLDVENIQIERRKVIQRMGILDILVDEAALVRIALLAFNCEAELLQLPLLDRLSLLFLILLSKPSTQS